MAQVAPPKRFVGLHNHTSASVYDGLGSPEEHIKHVVESGMDAWALTEHGHCNSYASAYLHAKKIAKAGTAFKFVPGAELYLHPDLSAWRAERARREAADDGDASAARAEAREAETVVTPLEAKADGDDEIEAIDVANSLTIEREEESKSNRRFDPINRRHHIVVIPKTAVGLERLFHLVSRGYREGFYRFPRIDYAMLREASAGDHLIVLTACLGGTMSYGALSCAQRVAFDSLGPSLLDDPALAQRVAAEHGAVYERLAWAVGARNVFLELQFNRLPAQDYVNRAMLAFAASEGLESQLVVAADAHYPRPELWKEREIYKKLGWLNYSEIDPEKLPKSRDELKAELYPKNAAQVWEEYERSRDRCSFYDDAIVAAAIERSWSIAHEVVGDVEPDRSMKLPTSMVVPEGKTAFSQLTALCKEGLVSMGLAGKPAYVERMKRELGIIKQKDFSAYFLTLREIIDVARAEMLTGPGRGSGAGSLVNYVLRITDVDPLKYDLLFERFLSPHREEAPDVDCLHVDHFVDAPDGPKRAGSLRVGDAVISAEGQIGFVTAVWPRALGPTETPLEVWLEGDGGTLGCVVCVADHRFLRSESGAGVALARELARGDTLIGRPFSVVVRDVRQRWHPSDSFVDVTVAPWGTFSVYPFDVLERDDGSLECARSNGAPL